MVVLNFGFTNISVSKGKPSKSKVNIKSGLNIEKVEVSKAIKAGEQVPFLIQFQYLVAYEPTKGKIQLDGELLFMANKDMAAKIETSWKDNKSLPKDIAVPIYNRILHSCTVEALLLSREVGLQAPVQLPKLKASTATKKTATKNTPKK